MINNDILSLDFNVPDVIKIFESEYDMATIKDIAQMAGVSCTTVSNVIHGRQGRVSADTVSRINDVIEKLGYVPNMSARALVSNSSRLIAIINHVVTNKEVIFMEDPFHSSITGIIERVLRDHGYYLMIRTVEQEEDLKTFLRTWNVDGLFMTGIFQDGFYDAIANLQIPIVLIDSYVKNQHVTNVGLEDYKGSYLAAQHLIRHGHRRIAFASPSFREAGVLHQRFKGYQDALRDYRIPFDASLLFESELDIDSCMNIGGQIAKRRDITALVATADVMAAGIMAGLQERGVRIPQDISVVGFDDVPTSRMTNPPLTTIHQDMDQKARIAVEFMLQRLENPSCPHREKILPVHLVERGSVCRRTQI